MSTLPPVPPNDAAMTGKITVGVSWEFSQGQSKRDLDVSAVCFDAVGAIVDAAYYNQLTACNYGVSHSGDERTGSKDGDDETITLDLDKLDNISAIVFCLSAYSGGSLICCETAHVSIKSGDNLLHSIDASNGETGRMTGLLLAMIYRDPSNGSWHLEKILEPVGAKDFHGAISNMRHHVDARLGEGLASDRKFQPDKHFDMKKGDYLEVPTSIADRRLTVGLGWTPKGGGSIDLDASALLLQDTDKDGDMDRIGVVYFGHKSVKGVWSSGDNTTGAGHGDDEKIYLELNNVEQCVEAIAIVVNIFTPGKSFERDFSDAYVRVYDELTGHEYAKYILNDGSVKTNGIVFIMFTRQANGSWELSTLASPCIGRTATDTQTSLWDCKKPCGRMKSVPTPQPLPKELKKHHSEHIEEQLRNHSDNQPDGCCTIM